MSIHDKNLSLAGVIYWSVINGQSLTMFAYLQSF